MSITSLPLRFQEPARIIFKAAADAGVPALLIGGAAARYYDAKRETKDLDINFGREFKLDPRFFSIKPGEEKGRLKATYLSPTSDQNVKIDISVKRDVAEILAYTKVVEHGVRIPLPSLLLAQKIVACGDRAAGADGKRDTDLRDITTMVDQLQKAKEQLPEDIKRKFLTPDVMNKFWQRLPSDEHFLVKDWLDELGVE